MHGMNIKRLSAKVIYSYQSRYVNLPQYFRIACLRHHIPRAVKLYWPFIAEYVRSTTTLTPVVCSFVGHPTGKLKLRIAASERQGTTFEYGSLLGLMSLKLSSLIIARKADPDVIGLHLFHVTSFVQQCANTVFISKLPFLSPV